MTGTEIALIIGSLAAFVTAIGGVFYSTRRLDQVIEENKRIDAENDELRAEIENNRRDIISLGEHYAGMSKDMGTLVILVNKLYNDYKQDTGRSPDIDWAVLDRALTIQHKTNPLGPVQIK